MAVWSEIQLSDIEHLRSDAEYYQPKYLEAKRIAGYTPLKYFGVNVIHPAEVKRVYSKSGLQIVLAQNNRDNYYDWSEKRFMPLNMRSVLTRNRLQPGDVTITRSGANFGQTSVITLESKTTELYACADLLIVKPGEIPGCLLATYSSFAP